MNPDLNKLFSLMRIEDLVSNESFLDRIRELKQSFPRLDELRLVLLDLFHANNDEEDE